jgi:PIN domain nuclease of toxin-antitoxin system
MRLLLDTVTFIWAVHSPERISRMAMSALESAGAVRELSSTSMAEIAIKHARNKIAFHPDDLAAGTRDLQIRVLPFTADHAFHLFRLPLHHPDPFDRQLIAQAMSEEIPVVTCDEKFELYKGLKVIW